MKLAWSEVTAIFGGRFDPPHVGHREAVRGLLKYPGVKRVLVIPSASPAYKPCVGSLETRVQLTQLNFDDFDPSEVEVDLREVRRAKPGAPTYSYDTIKELKPSFPNLAFVIGTDQLIQLPKWHRFPEVLTLCHWIILDRKLGESEGGKRHLAPLVAGGILTSMNSNTWKVMGGSTVLHWATTDAPEISSTQIREKLAKGQDLPENWLIPEVLTYLEKNKKYGIK